MILYDLDFKTTLLLGFPSGPVWLRLHVSSAGGVSRIPGWGTKIQHAVWYGQKEKKRSLCSVLGRKNKVTSVVLLQVRKDGGLKKAWAVRTEISRHIQRHFGGRSNRTCCWVEHEEH